MRGRIISMRRKRNSRPRCRSTRVLRRVQSTLPTFIARRTEMTRENASSRMQSVARRTTRRSKQALGLLMVRQKRSAQALDFLGAAARGEPGNARYAYVYAIASERCRKDKHRNRDAGEFYQSASL